MSNKNSTLLMSELEENEQFCMSLKSLIDSNCSNKTLSILAEELCDKSESIKFLFGALNL